MTIESIFRVAFWVLFAGVLVMRIYFAIKVRQAGERVMPNHEAIEREGTGMFFIRVVLFFILIGWLALYAINPTWMRLLSVPLPAWLRWIGFALGLASLGFWSWTQVALGKEWSPQLQLRKEHHLVTTRALRPNTAPTLHGYDRLWNKPGASDCRPFSYCFRNHDDCWRIYSRPQRRANDDKRVRGAI